MIKWKSLNAPLENDTPLEVSVKEHEGLNS